MHKLLGHHASPKLPSFAQYVRAVDEYFMHLIPGDQVIGNTCYNHWVHAQAKIAKRVFLTWRKTLPGRPDQKMEPAFDPATRMEPADKKRKVTKVDVGGADEDAARSSKDGANEIAVAEAAFDLMGEGEEGGGEPGAEAAAIVLDEGADSQDKEEVVHPYDEWVTPAGTSVCVGTGLTDAHLRRALGFLGGEHPAAEPAGLRVLHDGVCAPKRTLAAAAADALGRLLWWLLVPSAEASRVLQEVIQHLLGGAAAEKPAPERGLVAARSLVWPM
ncbi:unnamed protein product [Prorocentrum cordatum]|uniref:Uncharacterized protein n=1 Tax=Prorocentrum cordatum TaxID=2364126 RepID=A0ABN9P871_9DINO|nr:unnamed protein product [Polarella glacialis]